MGRESKKGKRNADSTTNSEVTPKKSKKDHSPLKSIEAPVTPSSTTGKSPAKKKVQTVLSTQDWPEADYAILVANVKKVAPLNNLRKYTVAAEKIDWKSVAFGPYDADECKAKWTDYVVAKLRHHRTLSEIIDDAEQWAKQPWTHFNMSKKQQRPPGLPKKPLTPYFRYFTKKRAAFAQENPDLSQAEVSKALTLKYNQLSEKKRQRYKSAYDSELALWKDEVAKFWQDHPELEERRTIERKNKSGKGRVPGEPEHPMTAFLHYKNAKGANKTHNEVREAFNALSDKKRLKWIRKAAADEGRYYDELAKFKKEHPDFDVPKLKSVLTKTEQELKDKADQRPEHPPNSGYILFTKHVMPELENFKSTEKMSEVSRRWKELSEEKRTHFNNKALRAADNYKKLFEEYLERLPENERARAKAADKVKELSTATQKKIAKLDKEAPVEEDQDDEEEESESD